MGTKNAFLTSTREPSVLGHHSGGVGERPVRFEGLRFICPKRNRLRCGGAVVEFAISFPLLILLLGMMFQFGYAFFVYNGLQSAVRSAARYAALADYDSPVGTTFQGLVKNVVVYGTPAPDLSVAKPLVPGLQVGNVVVDASDKDGVGIPLTVVVSITNYSVPPVWQSLTFNNKPRSVFVYLGQFK